MDILTNITVWKGDEMLCEHGIDKRVCGQCRDKPFTLSQAQENHLAEIKLKFYSLVDAKFRSGAEYHKDSGPLHEQSLMTILDFAIEEAIDQVTYLFTAKQRLMEFHSLTLTVEALNEQIHNAKMHKWVPAEVEKLYVCQTCLQRSDSPKEFLVHCIPVIIDDHT